MQKVDECPHLNARVHNITLMMMIFAFKQRFLCLLKKRLVTCVSFRSIIAIVIRHVPKHFFILILYIKFAMPKSFMGFSILISNFYHLTIWCVLSTVSDFKASFPFKSDFFLFSSHDSVMFKKVWIQKFKDGIMSHATIITFWTSSVANKFFKTKNADFLSILLTFWLWAQLITTTENI